jgi:predicted O-linked N-acetylglucosamine transferase (SPINDLY family)
LQFSLPSKLDAFLHAFSEVDILLESVPFNGGMTTIDALWQGVPLLSLTGNSHASRVGMSLMHAAGLDEWIADSIDAYIALAKSMSQRTSYLDNLRQSLPTKLAASPLGNTRQFATDMTKIWESAWYSATNH